MSRFAAGIKCTNPSCAATYDAVIESGYHAECPRCHQSNRVAGQEMSNEITGRCSRCNKPIDDHTKEGCK